MKTMKVTIEWGCWGFDIKSGDERVRLLVSRDDAEIGVGSYAVIAQSSRMMNGLSVRTPAGERHWYWDEVRAWLTRKPLTPPSAA